MPIPENVWDSFLELFECYGYWLLENLEGELHNDSVVGRQRVQTYFQYKFIFVIFYPIFENSKIHEKQVFFSETAKYQKSGYFAMANPANT